MPMTRPLSPATDGPRTRSDTLSPSCDFSTVMSWSRASSCACFSTTTSTSGRSQACTAIAPSKVSSVTLPGPVSLKVCVSEAVAPSVLTFTVQPASPTASALAPSTDTSRGVAAITSSVVERRPGARPGSTPAPRRPTSARPGTPRRGRPDRRRRLPPAVRDRRRPRARAGVVAHNRAASTMPRPAGPTSWRKAPSMVRMLPASVPSASTAQRSATRIGWSPSTRGRPERQAGAGGGVGDRQHAVDALGAHRQPHHRRVDVEAVADHLARDLVVGEHGPGQAGRPVRQRRHAIEQVRRVAGPGGDPGLGLVERRRRMAERHPMAGADQPGDQIEGAVQFRRQRDQPHRGAMRVDHLDDGSAVEFPVVPRGLARPRREPQARRRLRPVVVGVQEVALEVRAEHPGRPGRPRGRGHVHGGQEPFERRRRAGHRRRAEGGDAVTRQRRRHRRHRVGPAQHVGPLDAVDVPVDEAGQDPSPVAGDVVRGAGAVGADLDDGPVVDRQRGAVEDAIGQHQPRAAEPDHAAGPRSAAATPIMRWRRRPGAAPTPRPSMPPPAPRACGSGP